MWKYFTFFVPDVPWFKSHSEILLCIYACVHPVSILRVIINVRCSLIKKSEWSRGNTWLSCSRGTGFKSHSQFVLFIYACVHPVYILRVKINVRCILIKKSEWISGNTSLFLFQRYRVQIPLSFSSFYICPCPSCVHPKWYKKRQMQFNYEEWVVLWKYFTFFVPDVLGSNPTQRFFFVYLPVSIMCPS